MRKIAGLTLLLITNQVALGANCVFVENASLLSPGLEMSSFVPNSISFDTALHGIHQIIHGHDIVASIRYYHYDISSSDSGVYEKITLKLPFIRSGEMAQINLNSEIFRFSRGGSDWVEKGQGYYSTSVVGMAYINRKTTQLISIDFNAKLVTNFAQDPSEITGMAINRKYLVTLGDLSNLTPWLGSARTPDSNSNQSWRPTSQKELNDALEITCAAS